MSEHSFRESKMRNVKTGQSENDCKAHKNYGVAR